MSKDSAMNKKKTNGKVFNFLNGDKATITSIYNRDKSPFNTDTFILQSAYVNSDGVYSLSDKGEVFRHHKVSEKDRKFDSSTISPRDKLPSEKFGQPAQTLEEIASMLSDDNKSQKNFSPSMESLYEKQLQNAMSQSKMRKNASFDEKRDKFDLDRTIDRYAKTAEDLDAEAFGKRVGGTTVQRTIFRKDQDKDTYHQITAHEFKSIETLKKKLSKIKDVEEPQTLEDDVLMTDKQRSQYTLMKKASDILDLYVPGVIVNSRASAETTKKRFGFDLLDEENVEYVSDKKSDFFLKDGNNKLYVQMNHVDDPHSVPRVEHERKKTIFDKVAGVYASSKGWFNRNKKTISTAATAGAAGLIIGGFLSGDGYGLFDKKNKSDDEINTQTQKNITMDKPASDSRLDAKTTMSADAFMQYKVKAGDDRGRWGIVEDKLGDDLPDSTKVRLVNEGCLNDDVYTIGQADSLRKANVDIPKDKDPDYILPGQTISVPKGENAVSSGKQESFLGPVRPTSEDGKSHSIDDVLQPFFLKPDSGSDKPLPGPLSNNSFGGVSGGDDYLSEVKELVRQKNVHYSMNRMAGTDTFADKGSIADALRQYQSLASQGLVEKDDALRINKFDARIASDEMFADMRSLYLDDAVTLKEASGMLSEKYNMNVSASTISKYARLQLDDEPSGSDSFGIAANSKAINNQSTLGLDYLSVLEGLVHENNNGSLGVVGIDGFGSEKSVQGALKEYQHLFQAGVISKGPVIERFDANFACDELKYGMSRAFEKSGADASVLTNSAKSLSEEYGMRVTAEDIASFAQG